MSLRDTLRLKIEFERKVTQMSQFISMPQADIFAIPDANLQNLDFYYATDTRQVWIVLFNELQLLTEFAAGIQNYLQGAAWYEGAGTPSSGLGKNGDFYLNGSNGDVYTKTLLGWGSPICNIAGGGGGAVTSVAGRTGAVVLGESDITNLSSDLALKAPLLSPALTGTPTAPTPSSSDSSTKIATTAFVKEVAGDTELSELSDCDITSPTNGQILEYVVSGSPAVGKWENQPAPSGDTELAELTDVDISGPTNGEVLTYNSGAGKWENEAPTGGDTELSELTDVQLATPSDGDVLTYVSAASKWENKPASGGGGYSAAWPRATAGPWRAWYPVNYYNFGGNTYASGGNANYANYTPSYGVAVPVVLLADSSGAGAYFGGTQYLGAAGKPYFKSRANIGGGTAYSGYSNDDWRVWLGMCEFHSYGEWNSDTPPEACYAFRYSTAVDSTIKAIVFNGYGSAYGWANAVVIDTGVTPDTDFHDFAIDMTGANIVFSIDGTVVATVPIVFGPTGPVYPNDLYSAPFMSVQALPYGGGSPATYAGNAMFQYLYTDYQEL